MVQFILKNIKNEMNVSFEIINIDDSILANRFHIRDFCY